MDDTNPTKEEVEYVESILEDVRWLISGWADRLPGHEGGGGSRIYASDYFEALHDYAVELIRRGKAYVCDLSAEETEAYRGAPDQPGKDSPYRNRTVEESLDLIRADAGGRIPERRADAAGADRHGGAEYLDAGPGAVPHPPCGASPHGGCVVHLPAV